MDLHAITEPMIDVSNINYLSGFLEFPGFCSNNDIGGKHWIFWKNDLVVDVGIIDEKCCNIKVQNNIGTWYTSFV